MELGKLGSSRVIPLDVLPFSGVHPGTPTNHGVRPVLAPSVGKTAVVCNQKSQKGTDRMWPPATKVKKKFQKAFTKADRDEESG